MTQMTSCFRASPILLVAEVSFPHSERRAMSRWPLGNPSRPRRRYYPFRKTMSTLGVNCLSRKKGCASLGFEMTAELLKIEIEATRFKAVILRPLCQYSRAPSSKPPHSLLTGFDCVLLGHSESHVDSILTRTINALQPCEGTRSALLETSDKRPHRGTHHCWGVARTHHVPSLVFSLHR